MTNAFGGAVQRKDPDHKDVCDYGDCSRVIREVYEVTTATGGTLLMGACSDHGPDDAEPVRILGD